MEMRAICCQVLNEKNCQKVYLLTPCFLRKLIGTFAQAFNTCSLELLCYLVYNEHVFEELSKGTLFDSKK